MLLGWGIGGTLRGMSSSRWPAMAVGLFALLSVAAGCAASDGSESRETSASGDDVAEQVSETTTPPDDKVATTESPATTPATTQVPSTTIRATTTSTVPETTAVTVLAAETTTPRTTTVAPTTAAPTTAAPTTAAPTTAAPTTAAPTTAAPTTAAPTTAAPSAPANPGDTKNCGDFSSYAEAKSWFDTYYLYYGDVARLDSDGDLEPCESLPGAP